MRYKLSDCIDVLVDNRGKNPENYYDKEKYPVIDNYLIKNTIYPNLKEVKRYIDKDTFHNFLRNSLVEDDVIMTLVGNGIGNVSLSPSDKVVIIQNTIGFRSNEKILLKRYLYYYFQYRYEDLINFNRGSSQPSIKKTDILNMDIEIPDIKYQDNAIKLLGNIDEKIYLNNKLNDNLAKVSRTIYDYHFNKCFPYLEDAEITSECGVLPKGWDRGQLSDLVKVKYGKDHKKLDNGDIPVYGSGGIMRFVDKFLYTGESVLIPRKGSLNNVLYVNDSFWSVDTMFYTVMKFDNIAKYIYFFMLDKDLISMNAGSAVPSMTTDILNKMVIKIPPKRKLQQFEETVTPLFEMIISNQCENETLSKLRDTLLLKLMSGEIDLDNFDLNI